ncbi:hypothetical protein AGR1B_pa0121 [Agrobacterium fabacearum S56]|nr:hypothetical protein AGR1B_pa0121 [Agrobacterium fabacearum S56]
MHGSHNGGEAGARAGGYYGIISELES